MNLFTPPTRVEVKERRKKTAFMRHVRFMDKLFTTFNPAVCAIVFYIVYVLIRR